ncbi:MAG: tRNA uridine-5-carboxymethylaminomethyl(34) synthesis enzyme MnmG, partial [Pseudomonadota bacterium]|nr:tRNA uridine-5-carboxymethylaminomethyl(34) synthesis enzyme MnmG [Pseudomonadota bacterium]
MASTDHYDVIIVGGGHAGTEAACAAARMGASTLLITHSLDTIGQMSCNPAIGGIGKGHLVKEISAMGGIMPVAADEAAIHMRILNCSKGAAVQSTRAQADRSLYRSAVRRLVDEQENLSCFQQAVDDLILRNGKVIGVRTTLGICFFAKAVVLTTGTFLSGKIHVGQHNSSGGRASEPSSDGLSAFLRKCSTITYGRLKTGTPPRIDKKSIDFNGLAVQPTEPTLPYFSLWPDPCEHPRQVECHITKTNPKTHAIIRENLSLSPMFCGAIQGKGPRYCPSIEDKVHRFAHQESHQVFLEPEGLSVGEIYPNGISTSLPYQAQIAMVRSIEGLENARITRPGYAIEYDFFNPQGLTPWLESKAVESLFFAGQINGTTGYEEAAAQGLLAGINAARLASGQSTWYPKRHQAYLGVLVDDLINMGTQEPYRMFTSRAEYRLLLREGNADSRLSEDAHRLGCLTEKNWNSWQQKSATIAEYLAKAEKITVQPQDDFSQYLARFHNIQIQKPCKLAALMKRPEVQASSIVAVFGEVFSQIEALEEVMVTQKYVGYISRQSLEVARQARQEQTII